MKIKIQGCFALGDTTLVYRKDMGSGRIGLTIYPTTLTKKLAVRRETLAGLPEIETLPRQFPVPRAWNVESLIQLHLRGDAVNNGFSNGRSMRNSVSPSRVSTFATCP